jgi:hypothetical protein
MRAQPRRGVVRCVAFAAAIAALSAQPRVDHLQDASAILEQWLGPPPSPSPSAVRVTPRRPAALMETERDTALRLARQWWPQPAVAMTEGASQYVANHVVAALFDQAFGRAGAGVMSIAMFGGTRVTAFPQLRYDGPAAGLDRSRLNEPAARVALALASIERMAGRPRLIAGLRAAVAAQPADDAVAIRALSDGLGQEVGWLFDAALDPEKIMDYAIDSVTVAGCGAQCERVTVEVTHRGTASFSPLEIRALFADGQSASAVWDGQGASKRFAFEGPARPVRVDVDPGHFNLLDTNLIDQQRSMGGATNVSVAKWAARWVVWLQDALLVYTTIV